LHDLAPERAEILCHGYQADDSATADGCFRKRFDNRLPSRMQGRSTAKCIAAAATIEAIVAITAALP
jgi:hypothetical protein